MDSKEEKIVKMDAEVDPEKELTCVLSAIKKLKKRNLKQKLQKYEEVDHDSREKKCHKTFQIWKRLST